MGLFDRLKRNKAANLTITPSAGGVFPSTPTNPPRRGTREMFLAYNQQPWFRAIVGKIARDVASVPWRLYAKSSVKGDESKWRPGVDKSERDPSTALAGKGMRRKALESMRAAGQLRELTEHPLLNFLCRPNSRMTGLAARELEQVWLDIKGEAFRLIDTNDQGMPTGYLPVPSHWVQSLPTKEQPYYRVTILNAQYLVPEKNMLYLRHLDPANPFGRGTGVGEAFGDELETDEYAAKYIKAFFYNFAMPEVLVSVEGGTPTELKVLQAKWEAEHSGAWQRFKTRFLTGKMNVQRLDSSFKDQQLVDLRKFGHDFLRETFGVPPEVVGVLDNANRSTIDASSYLYAHGVLVPRMEFQRMELQTFLVPRFDESLILDYDDPTPENRQFSLEVAKAAPYAFSLNEWRGLAEHEPVPEFVGVYPPLVMPGQSAMQGGDAAEPAAPAKKPKAKPEEDEKGADPAWVRNLQRSDWKKIS